MSPRLTELLARFKGYVMPDAEREAQRQSWVRGEMGMGNDAQEARDRYDVEACDECDVAESEAAVLDQRRYVLLLPGQAAVNLDGKVTMLDVTQILLTAVQP